MNKPRVQLKRASPLKRSGLNDPERAAVVKAYTAVRHEVANSLNRTANLAALAIGAPMSMLCWVGEASVRLVGLYGLGVDMLPRSIPKQLDLILPERPVQTTNPVDLLTVTQVVSSAERFHFFAAVPLRSKSGHFIGSLCVMDRQVRQLTPTQLEILLGLADGVMSELEARLEVQRLRADEPVVTRTTSVATQKPLSQLLFESTEEAVILMDLDGVITSWNAGAERLHGFTAGEALGRNVAFLIPQGAEGTVQALVARVASGERIPPFEAQRMHKSGFRVNVRVALGPVRDETGRVVAVAIFSGAPGNLAQADQNLRLQQLTQNLPIFVAQFDAAGVFTYAEGQSMRRIGLEVTELIGRSAFHVYRNYPAILEAISSVLGGETLHTTIQWRGRHFEIWLSPLMSQGRPAGLQGLSIDITDRVTTQSALVQSEAQLQEVLQALPVLVLRCDEHGIITMLEGRDTTAQFANERLGQSAFEIYGSSQTIMVSLRRALSGEAFNTTIEWRGGYRECWVSPLFDGDRISGATAIVIDVTEQVQGRLELDRARHDLELITERLPLVVLKSDTEGRVSYIGGGALFEMREQRILPETEGRVGNRVVDDFHDAPQALKAFAQLEHGQTINALIEWKERVFDAWLSPIIEDGLPNGAIAVGMDITTRARAEAQLEGARRDLQQITSSLPVVLLKVDAGGNITFLEAHSLPSLDVDYSLVGQPFDAMFAHVPQVLEIGYQVRRGRSVRTELPWGELFFEVFVTPILQDGVFTGATAVALDITARKHAETQLRSTRAQLEGLLARLPVLVMSCDLQGRVTLIEGKGLMHLGGSAQPLIGLDLRQLFKGNRDALQTLDRAIKGEAFEIIFPFGQVMARVFVSPLFENNQLIGSSGIIIDVSDEYEAERQRLKMLEELISTETALARERETALAVSQGIEEGLCVIGASGALEFANPASSKVLGFSERELLGRDLNSLVVQEDRAAYAQMMRELEANQGGTHRFSVIRADEQTALLEVRCSPRFEEAEYSGAFMLFSDITERDRLERELAATRADFEREQRYALEINEAVTQGLLVLNKALKIEYSNSAAMRLVGREASTLLGHNPLQLVHPDETDTIQTNWARVLAGETVNYQHRLIRGDGEIITIDVTAYPRFDTERELIGAVIMFSDITQALQQQQDLRAASANFEREQRLTSTLVNTVTQGLAIIDADGRYEYVNPARAHIQGYEPNEMIGRFGHEFVLEEEWERLQGGLKAIQAGQSVRQVVRLNHRDGHELEVEQYTSPRFENGQLIGEVSVMNDVTETRRIERELEAARAEADRDKDFAYMVANRVPQALTISDSERRFTYVNPAFEQLFGYSADELLGQPADAYLAPQQPEVLERIMADWAVGKSSSYRIKGLHKTDGEVEVLATFTPRDEGGIIAVLTRFDEQVRRELELRGALSSAQARLEREQQIGYLISESVGQGLTVIDADGVLEYVNPALTRMIGYGASELVGQPMQTLVNDEGVLIMNQQFKSRQSGEMTTYINHFLHKDGHRFEVEITGYPRFEQNVFHGVIAVITDLTETKRQEQALRDSESRYRELYGKAEAQARNLQLIDAVRSAFVGDQDVQTVVHTMVERIRETLDVPLVSVYFVEDEELVLQHAVNYEQIFERLPLRNGGVMARTAINGQAVLVENAKLISDFKYALSNIASELCVPIMHGDEVLGVINLESTVPYAFNDNDQRVMTMLAERLSALIVRSKVYTEFEVARQRDEERLRMLEAAMNGASEMILITEANLETPGPRIVYSNPALQRQTGYSAEELQQTTPRILQGERTDRATLTQLKKALARGEAFSGEVINYRKDGSTYEVEWSINPVRDSADQITHFVSVQRDKEELRRMTRLLQNFRRLAGRTANFKTSSSFQGLETEFKDLKLELSLGGAMQGYLEQIGGANALVQMLALTQPSGAIHLPGNRIVYIKNQKIISIEHPTLTGQSAVLETLALFEGLFSFDPDGQAERADLEFDPTALSLESEAAPSVINDPTSSGVIVLASMDIAQLFMQGVGGEHHFRASLDARAEGEKVVLRGQGFTLVIMEGGLSDVPAAVER